MPSARNMYDEILEFIKLKLAAVFAELEVLLDLPCKQAEEGDGRVRLRLQQGDGKAANL